MEDGEGGDEDEDRTKKTPQEIDGHFLPCGSGWGVAVQGDGGLGGGGGGWVGVTATPESCSAELRCRGNVDAWCDLTCNASLNLRKWNK